MSILVPYKSWIFCPTCNIYVLFGVDTDFSTSAIAQMLTGDDTFNVPVAHCHICDGTRLRHIKSATRNVNKSISYIEYEHPINIREPVSTQSSTQSSTQESYCVIL